MDNMSLVAADAVIAIRAIADEMEALNFGASEALLRERLTCAVQRTRSAEAELVARIRLLNRLKP